MIKKILILLIFLNFQSCNSNNKEYKKNKIEFLNNLNKEDEIFLLKISDTNYYNNEIENYKIDKLTPILAVYNIAGKIVPNESVMKSLKKKGYNTTLKYNKNYNTIILSRYNKQIGTYTDGTNAFDLYSTILLLNNNKIRVLDKKYSKPPNSKRRYKNNGKKFGHSGKSFDSSDIIRIISTNNN